MGVEKNEKRIVGNKVALGNMTNTLFCSTFVVRGNAQAVVTAVGMNTEMGKIAAMLQGNKASKLRLKKVLISSAK